MPSLRTTQLSSLSRTLKLVLRPGTLTTSREPFSTAPLVSALASSRESSRDQSYRSLFLWCTAAAATATLISSDTILKSVCEKKVPSSTALKEEPTPSNPFWPSGISSSDIDDLVSDCLNDPTINLSTVPDYIERQIYKSTIQLTLNTVYQALAKVHGTPILRHEFQLRRIPEPKTAEMKREHLAEMQGSVQEDVLEAVADRLIANKAINQPLIPDVVEQQLYVNCLKIVFRLLDMLAASFRLTVCGHDVRLTLEPSSMARRTLQNFARDQAALTQIDTQLLLDEVMEQAGIDMLETNAERSLWERFWNPANNEFIAQLHVILYALILGIMDDLLNHTQLEVLSDRIQFDLVPQQVVQASKTVDLPAQKARASSQERLDDGSPSASPVLLLSTFTAGVGVGLAFMALLGSNM